MDAARAKELVGLNIAVIPANVPVGTLLKPALRTFLGKPVISYSIAAAKSSGVFDRILVVADDSTTTAVVKRLGAAVPYAQPSWIRNEPAAIVDTMADSAAWIRSIEPAVRAICCISPVAPLLQSGHLRRGLAVLTDGHWTYAFGAVPCKVDSRRALVKSDNGYVKPLVAANSADGTSGSSEYLHDAEMFYWGTAAAWTSGEPLFVGRSAASW